MLLLENYYEEIEDYAPEHIERELHKAYKDSEEIFDENILWRNQADAWAKSKYMSNPKPMSKVANVTITGKQVISNLKLYHLNDIVLGDNLILTSDRKGGSINSESVHRIIKNIVIPYICN